MLERFTTAAREVVRGAQTEARQCGHRLIGTEHLLLALLHPTTGIPYDLLTAAGLGHDRVVTAIARLTDSAEPLGPADAAALEAIGIDLEAVRAKLEGTFGPGALDPPAPVPKRGLFGRRKQPSTSGHRPFSPRAKVILELALREALRLHHGYIGTEHLLLGLIREGRGLAAKILVDAGIDLNDLRTRTEAAITAAKK